jgi:FMN reductase
MTKTAPLIVGVGGTTRANSSSERALRVALSAAEAMGATTRLVAGPDLPVEPYDPARPERTDRALNLVAAMRAADGLIIASPGYHGSISGLVKNALDFTEDMRGDARPYFDGRAVGAIVSAEGAQALGSTLAAIRSIVHALRGWPTPYAALVNAAQKPFDADGRPTAETEAALSLVGRQVTEFALMRRAYLDRG